MNTTRVRNETDGNEPEISKPVSKLFMGGYMAGGAGKGDTRDSGKEQAHLVLHTSVRILQ